MENLQIFIPTLNRSKQFEKKTYKLLLENDLLANCKLLIQTDEDEQNYSHFNIPIVRTPLGLKDTMNWVIENTDFNSLCLKLDDDITGVKRLKKDKGLELMPLKELLETMISQMDIHNADLCGLYPNANDLCMRREKDIILGNTFCVGIIQMFRNKKITLNLGGKGDMEMCLLYYKNGYNCLRLNKYCSRHYVNGKGGLEKIRTQDYEDTEHNYIMDNYAEYIARETKHKNGNRGCVFKKLPHHNILPKFLPKLNSANCEELFEELKKNTIEISRTRTNSGYGRSQPFGYVIKRFGLPFGLSRHSIKKPKLFQTLINMGHKIENNNFTTIQVNHNYECRPHIDGKNMGESIIFAVGDYTGGELCIKINGKYQEYNIKNKPLLFNGSLYEHFVKPITSGNRYSFVYFKLKDYGAEDFKYL
jgi:hypothetical protein